VITGRAFIESPNTGGDCRLVCWTSLGPIINYCKVLHGVCIDLFSKARLSRRLSIVEVLFVIAYMFYASISFSIFDLALCTLVHALGFQFVSCVAVSV